MVNSTFVATLYVNPVTGNDTNAGSRLSPFKSLTHALKSTRTTAIIQLASGTYNQENGELFPLVIPAGILIVGNESNKGQGIIISGGGEYQSPSFGTQNITLLLLGDASLLGVTVTNSLPKGTGVWIESAFPTLANNTFSACGREGVFITGNAKPAVVDNLFIKNNVSGLMIARNSKGEILRNVFEHNSFGIAISDFAAPLLASNKLSANVTAIALSRDARPVLRRNLILDNTQGGLLVNGNAIPDLGNPQEPADNVFHGQGEFDLQNLTLTKLTSVGNQINPVLVKGLVDLITQTTDISPQIITNSSFSDLRGHWATAFITALVSKGFISGFPDGTFQPAIPMNRAEYAALIAKVWNLPINQEQEAYFTDIQPGFWAATAISQAVKNGFIDGYPDQTFRPGQNLTRVQAIVSMVKGLNLSDSSPHVLMQYSDRAQIPSYATNAVAIATDKLLVVNYPRIDQLEPMREITRAEVAVLTYQALVTQGKEPAIDSPYIVTPPQSNISSGSDLVGHWAEPFIRALIDMGLTQGFVNGKYQPDKPLTRAEYAALVTAAFKPNAKRPATQFTDIPQDFWAASAIQIATGGGFVGGFSDRTFRPQQNVLRLQVIVSLVNGLGLSSQDNKTLLMYHDQKSIPGYARQAVATATDKKIVVSYPDTNLIAPSAEATRAEVAAMVYQALVVTSGAKAINSPYIVLHIRN